MSGWARVTLTKRMFLGNDKTEVVSYPAYVYYRDGERDMGKVTKTGTARDNYPWEWETEKRHGLAGTMAEAKQAVEDAVAADLAPAGPTDEERMRVARKVAQWHLGSADWANLIVTAYLSPELAEKNLREEKEA